MSCEKESWTQFLASERNNNSAGGDNPRASLAPPQIFHESVSGTSIPNLVVYENSGQKAVLVRSFGVGQTYLKATFENGVVLFNANHALLGGFYDAFKVLETKNWIVSGAHIFDSNLGTLIGTSSVIPDSLINSSSVFETSAGDVVFMRSVEDQQQNTNYEFYQISLDQNSQIQATFLWSTPDVPYAYYAPNDNLLFTEAGQGRALLTGAVKWSFSPLMPLSNNLAGTYYAGFDAEGSAYICYLNEVGGTPEYPEIQIKLKKLSFPVNQSAGMNWDVDLSQYLATQNGSPLWASNEPQYPRSFVITKNYIWFLQSRLLFAGVSQAGCQIIGGGPCPPDILRDSPWFDSHNTEMTLVQVSAATGSKVRTHVLPQQESDNSNWNGGAQILGADEPDEDWVIGHTIINEQDIVRSLLFVAQGNRLTIDLLLYPPEYNEELEILEQDPQYVTDTNLPHNRIFFSAIVGGNVYYPNFEANQTQSIRRLGLWLAPEDSVHEE